MILVLMDGSIKILRGIIIPEDLVGQIIEIIPII